MPLCAVMFRLAAAPGLAMPRHAASLRSAVPLRSVRLRGGVPPRLVSNRLYAVVWCAAGRSSDVLRQAARLSREALCRWALSGVAMPLRLVLIGRFASCGLGRTRYVMPLRNARARIAALRCRVLGCRSVPFGIVSPLCLAWESSAARYCQVWSRRCVRYRVDTPLRLV
jgi:hypothetical protein